MIEKFKNHNTENLLFNHKDRILLTVSGGIDSMAMSHIFLRQNIDFGIAHCNFMLRGDESDQDQAFVESFAKKNKISFHTINFDTAHIATERKISIQMAARELRYNWFDKISGEYGYTKIATAHNLNDLAETFLINLSRGTGIKGLTGIPVKSGKVIRPMLFASREHIENYVKQSSILFREDSSNSETKYLRNAIRHQIIKPFEVITPHFLHAVKLTSKLLQSVNLIYEENISKIRSELFVEKKDNEIHIDISLLKESVIKAETLYELLLPYNFSFDNCEQILNSLEHQSGIQFFSSTHRLVKDRSSLILIPVQNFNNQIFTISENTLNKNLPFKLIINRIDSTQLSSLKQPLNTAIFDAEKVRLPLLLRKWRDGDYFYPFGMKGKKKISDFFNDNKFSRIDKENTWILTSGEEIIWIVNHRTDNRYRVTETTKEILRIITEQL